MPTRAVTDHTWTGDEVNWSAAPHQYAAIHFHDDDLDDAGWEPSFELKVTDSLRSGVYAMRLEADGYEEYVPFYVRPPAGTATAHVAFLAPTNTYLAYANERMYFNVCAGLGTNPYAPIRFCCRPEATLLTLVPRS